jgi:hypothetical protein
VIAATRAATARASLRTMMEAEAGGVFAFAFLVAVAFCLIGRGVPELSAFAACRRRNHVRRETPSASHGFACSIESRVAFVALLALPVALIL